MIKDISEVSWPGWETVGILGRGSFGAVYEIHRDVLGEKEKAALKVISIPQSESEIQELYNDGYDNESVAETFQAQLKSIVNEYSMMRRLNDCANVVHCDDVRYEQKADGIGWDIYIKMELLTPLAQALPEEIPEETVIRVGKDMCNALMLCAKHNIVHRDIKPQNMFVSPNGAYKLGDFGVAKTVERTMGGTKIGTFKYMAPEVYHSNPYGATADIYSLGLVLYWMLNYRRMPFMPLPPAKVLAGMDGDAANRRLSGEQIPPPATGSEELKRIVLKACAFNTTERYKSASEMLAALENIGRNPVVVPVVSTSFQQSPEDTVRVRRAEPAFSTTMQVQRPVQKPQDTVYSPPMQQSTVIKPSQKKKKAFPVAAFLIILLLIAAICVAVLLLGQGNNSSDDQEIDQVTTTEKSETPEDPHPDSQGDEGEDTENPNQSKPVVPGATNPSVPDIKEPDTSNPTATDPEITKPEVTEPEITEPEITEPEITEPDPPAHEEGSKEIKVGDVVTFGVYEQDNILSNGKESIEWQVLEVQDGKALVISKYALDCQSYNTEYESVTWETCTLRSWLNDDFLNAAFTTGEQTRIPTVTVSADKNPSYDTNPGKTTQDKVFLLSINEAYQYFSSDDARSCDPTAYAIAQGCWTFDDTSSSYYGNCWWWLRSPGDYQGNAAFVGTAGWVLDSGYFVDHGSNAVRPALWIDLNGL